MSVRTPVLALTAAALALAGTLAPVAAGGEPEAGPTWGPVKRLAGSPRGESVAVDGRGNTTVVWATSWTHPTRPRAVMALRRSADGTWGRPKVVGRGYAPRVAADARGNVTVVWLTQRRGHSDGVAAARRPVGGAWSDPVRLSRDLRVPGYPDDGEEPFGAARLDLAVSPRGVAVVAWDWGSDPRGKPWRIQAVVRPAGGPWGDRVAVTPPSGATRPLVGIGENGTAVLVYSRQRTGHPQTLVARRFVADHWTAPTRLTREGYDPALAVDRAGNAVVTFLRDFVRVEAVRRPAAGRWREPRRLSPRGVEINDAALAMNGRGTALVALVRASGRVDLVRRPPGGRWSAPTAVSPAAASVFDVLVGLNGVGDTFVGWGGYALHGRYRAHGGAWGDRTTVSPDAGVEVLERTYVRVTPAGDVVVLWKQEERPLKVRVLSVP